VDGYALQIVTFWRLWKSAASRTGFALHFAI
jgi:hypothetical protein